MALREYYEVDTDGNIIGVHVKNPEVDVIPVNYKLGWGEGLFSPRYDFTLSKWVEGKPQTEIDSIRQKQKDEEEIENLKSYLFQTDFYYIRQIETGTPVKAEIVTERIKARNRLKELGL